MFTLYKDVFFNRSYRHETSELGNFSTKRSVIKRSEFPPENRHRRRILRSHELYAKTKILYPLLDSPKRNDPV